MKSMLVRFSFFDYFIQTKEIYCEHINDNFYETISGVLGKKNDKLTIRRYYANSDKNIWRLLKYSNIQIKATLNILHGNIEPRLEISLYTTLHLIFLQ